MNILSQKTIDYINNIDNADERYQKGLDLVKAANRLARQNGSSKATSINVRFDHKDAITRQVTYHYEKISTGEWVPKAYVNKCRGKGVAYIAAVCDVQISVRDLFLKI
jgi:hypothetical protein